MREGLKHMNGKNYVFIGTFDVHDVKFYRGIHTKSPETRNVYCFKNIALFKTPTVILADHVWCVGPYFVRLDKGVKYKFTATIKPYKKLNSPELNYGLSGVDNFEELIT